MEQLNFDKYEGLGNDFILVDEIEPVSGKLATALCDRRRGVGGDGVLWVSPSETAGVDAVMVVVNADGSQPEMCGNGLRCVALHLARKSGRENAQLRIQTGAGILPCLVERSGAAVSVRTGLGRGVLGGIHNHDGRSFQVVSTGNPHAVTFGEIPSDREIDAVGALVSASQPDGANVEFAQKTPSGFQVVVWERGVGRTLACGTGAGATVVAAVAAGLAAVDTPQNVRLPGGELSVRVNSGHEITLTGPARHVFRGTVKPVDMA